jgi:hypothetical protein
MSIKMKTSCDNKNVCNIPRKEKCDYWKECTSHGPCLACDYQMSGKCTNKKAWLSNQYVTPDIGQKNED